MTRLADKLQRKGVDHARLAQRIARQPDRIDEVIEAGADRPGIKYGSSKILRLLSDAHPELLYPKIDFFVERLDHDNNFFRWDAICVLGNLAGVDTRGVIDEVFERYFAPIRGPVLITASNIAKGGRQIARARPDLVEDVVTQLLKVEKGRYESDECRNILIGQIVDICGEIFDLIGRQRRVINFVRRHVDNARPSTRKKVEKFLRKRATPS